MTCGYDQWKTRSPDDEPGSWNMMRCDQCDDLLRENAGMADEIAFWAYQAKWYFALATGLGNYDKLPRNLQKQVDDSLEQARIQENQERIGHVDPAHDIGN